MILIILAVISAAAAITYGVYLRHPMNYQMYNSSSIQYEKGTVERVLSEQTEYDESTGMRLGLQILEVKMRSGNFKGQKIGVENNLSTTHNVPVSAGQSVIVKVDQPENASAYFTIYNYDRTRGVLAAAAIFFILMILVGRAKGARSVLGLIFSLFFVFGRTNCPHFSYTLAVLPIIDKSSQKEYTLCNVRKG